MAGTHHIIMIIIQELTLSVCDLLLTPVQCYYHSLRSSDSVAWHLGIFSALFNEDSEAAHKQLYRGGLLEVCVCVCLSVTHKHSYTEREKTNYFYVSETGLCVLFWPVVRGIWMFLTRSRFDAFDTCWEIPFRSMNVNLLVELEEELRDHPSHLDSSSGDHECQHTILWQSNGYWDVSVCTRMVDPPMLQASAMWYRSTCHYSLHGKMLFFLNLSSRMTHHCFLL